MLLTAGRTSQTKAESTCDDGHAVAVRRIHIVDHDAGGCDIIRRALRPGGTVGATVREHAGIDGLLAELACAESPEVVLLVRRPNTGDDLDGLTHAIRANRGPVILLADGLDDELAARCIERGAADCLSISQIQTAPAVLQHAIDRSMDWFRLDSQNRNFQEELIAKNRRLAELCDLSHAFVDNVSHEFRTPLAVLKEFIALFLDDLTGPINEAQAQYLQIMAGKVDDLALMVNDLLDTSRMDAGLLGAARVRCRVAEIVESASAGLDQRAASQGVTLRIHCPSGLPELYCDPEKVGRVLTNLVINALKFTPEGGRVEVTVGLSKADPRMVAVAVADSGPGIPDENLQDIFERFRQIRHPRFASRGFGLGLSIVRELIRLNLGTIHVESRLGVGSTFTFCIPWHDTAHLVPLYLERLGELGADSPGLNLIVMAVDHPAAPVRREAIDLVNRSLRGHDLMLPHDHQAGGLILTPGAEAGPRIDQLLTAVQTAYRGMPDQHVPQVRFDAIDHWTLGLDGPAVITRRSIHELELHRGEYVRV